MHSLGLKFYSSDTRVALDTQTAVGTLGSDVMPASAVSTIRTVAPKPALRILSVDALRGLAALEVCLFHFLGRSDSPLFARFEHTPLPNHGWLGVHAFFVISGFVVPWSMFRSHYTIGDIGRFIARRIVRLDPPYFVSIVAIIVLNVLIPGTIDQAVPLQVDAHLLLAHLFYGVSNFFTSFSPLNSVYWTLAIEFQYYVAISVAMPQLVHSVQRAIYVLAVALGLALWSPSAVPFLHWTPVFCFGAVLFLVLSDYWRWSWAAWAWLAVGLVCYLVDGVSVTLTAALTTAAIALWKTPGRPFIYLGQISFSLYLIHVPIGGRIVMHWPFESLSSRVVSVMVATTVSILTAHLMWRFVEAPFQQLASRIGYRGSTPLAPPAAL